MSTETKEMSAPRQKVMAHFVTRVDTTSGASEVLGMSTTAIRKHLAAIANLSRYELNTFKRRNKVYYTLKAVA